MPDDKNGREAQARAEENRQRERAVTEELERWDETEPAVSDQALEDVERELEAVSFPATAADIVGSVGQTPLETPDKTYAVADLLPETDAERFDDPAEVRARVARPTVAAAMKRIVEATDRSDWDRLGSQRRAYEKTLRALAAIDADDDDEGVTHVTDWIVERIRDGNHPGSRAVRREAAKFCRERGYPISADEWLGI